MGEGSSACCCWEEELLEVCGRREDFDWLSGMSNSFEMSFRSPLSPDLADHKEVELGREEKQGGRGGGDERGGEYLPEQSSENRAE